MEFEFAHLTFIIFNSCFCDPNLALTNYNLDAEMQGWGKGGAGIPGTFSHETEMTEKDRNFRENNGK